MKHILLVLLFILNLSAQERIVSLSPSITEIVYALHAGSEMVATSSYSLYPKAATKLPIIGGYTNPNIEKIISFAPTLAIGHDFNANTLEKIKHFHIKTLKLNLDTIENIKKSITILGQNLHRKNKAKILVKNINNAIQEAQKVLKPHTVMIVYGLKEDLSGGIYIAGKDIFFNDIIKLCGNANAYTDTWTEQPVLNYENVIALNPDQIIILHSHATEPNVNVQRALKNWYALPTNASQNHKISIVDEDYLHIPSQRVALTIRRLSREMNR